MFVEYSSIRVFAAPILNGKRAFARFSLRMGAANDEWVRGAANDEWVRGEIYLIIIYSFYYYIIELAREVYYYYLKILRFYLLNNIEKILIILFRLVNILNIF